MIIVLITVYVTAVTGFHLNVFLTFCSTCGVMIMHIIHRKLFSFSARWSYSHIFISCGFNNPTCFGIKVYFLDHCQREAEPEYGVGIRDCSIA
jgi:hypothetical protein